MEMGYSWVKLFIISLAVPVFLHNRKCGGVLGGRLEDDCISVIAGRCCISAYQRGRIAGIGGVKMEILKIIIEQLEAGNEIDADSLHEYLLKLPAEKYFELYGKMQANVLGVPRFPSCYVPNP